MPNVGADPLAARNSHRRRQRLLACNQPSFRAERAISLRFSAPLTHSKILVPGAATFAFKGAGFDRSEDHIRSNHILLSYLLMFANIRAILHCESDSESRSPPIRSFLVPFGTLCKKQGGRGTPFPDFRIRLASDTIPRRGLVAIPNHSWRVSASPKVPIALSTSTRSMDEICPAV